MNEQDHRLERLWERGWDGHEKAQLLRMSQLSFLDKIKWLEETQELLQNIQELRKSSPLSR